MLDCLHPLSEVVIASGLKHNGAEMCAAREGAGARTMSDVFEDGVGCGEH